MAEERLMQKIALLEKEVAHYQEMLGLNSDGQPTLAIRGYLAYQKMLEQQIRHVEGFKLTADVVEGKKSENAAYERTEKMHAELPAKITALHRLKDELKLVYTEEDTAPKKIAASPQSIHSLIN